MQSLFIAVSLVPRSFLRVASYGAVLALLQLSVVGCAGGGGGGDGGVDGGGTCTATAVTLTPSATELWLGTTVNLTAGGTAVNGAFTWSVVAAPPGSTATVSGTTANATFTADLQGAYTLRAAGNGNCSSTPQADTIVSFYDAMVPYEMQTPLVAKADGSATTVGYTQSLTLRLGGALSVAPLDGSPAYPAYLSTANKASSAFGDYLYTYAHGGYAADTWESTPSTPAKVVFSWFNNTNTALASYATTTATSGRILYAATTNSRAAGPAPSVIYGPITDPSTTVDDLGLSVTSYGTAILAQPRISPDGTRVAFLKIFHDDNSASTYTKVVTVGLDGTNARDVANYFVTGYAPAAGHVTPGTTARPQWLSNTILAWLRVTGANQWRLVTANDVANATVNATYMTCSGALPRQFAFVPGAAAGAVDTIAADALPAAGQIGQLWRYANLAGTCNGTQLSNIATADYYVGGFALTADNSKVLYTVGTGTGSTSIKDVYIVNASGGSAPTKITLSGGVGSGIGVASPRFVAGDTRFVLTVNGKPTSYLLDGTSPHVIESAPVAGNAYSHFGHGAVTFSICSVSGETFVSGRHGSAALPFAFLSLLGLALVVRRRRTR